MMQYPDDLFLIFCASKKFQKTIADVVSRHGISCEFYNADLSYDERKRIYNEELKNQTNGIY
jgi:superfamily II helicase